VASRSLPDAWHAAVNDVVRTTAEPGHPWSCAGGTIELELVGQGAVLRVAREGEPAATRIVDEPSDVLPLAQALLATPLGPSDETAATTKTTASSAEVAARPPEPLAPKPPARREAISGPKAANSVSPESSKHVRRLLLSAGVDARGVADSGVTWLGPTASVALQLGRWLPSISLREQSAIFSQRPTIDEWSVALAVQSRLPISAFELRAGVMLRGAAVQRALPERRGEQSRLEGRVGAVTSFVIPLFSWSNLVLSADADAVVVSRQSAEPAPAAGDEAPTSFPTYTLGGSLCLEIPL
jgi:hypothetical protein